MINSLEESLEIELQNLYPDSNPFDASSISKISKSKFAQNYHFLCKECGEVPKIEFFAKNKIKFKCETCKESKELSIKEVYDFLYYSEGIEPINKLRCSLHPDEKFIFYCKTCNKNLCPKCVEECLKNHEKQIISLALESDIMYKKEYIKEKIKEKEESFIKDEISLNSDEKSNTICYEYASKSQNSNNILKDEYFLVIQKKDNIKNNINNNESREEIINIMNEINNDELHDEEYYYINLFTIIIYDYENYPNHNHFDTIFSIEKFVLLSLGDYNEIILKYEFKKENINGYSSIELFGDKFVNNNKDNCFLVVNELIMELSKTVKLSDIFDNSYLYKNNSIQLKVRLIERKTKLMSDLSYMFDGISSLDSTSSFSNFNSSNITKMSGMFYNCSSITKLPDISSLNTKKVTDMSNMFYNCSSITKLPDISKWDTINLIDVSHMFQNCESLSSLPDMSKWRIDNIKSMNNMFENCKSIKSSPSILKWKIKKDVNISDIFNGCKFKEIIEKKESNDYKTIKFWNSLEFISNKIRCCLEKLYLFSCFFNIFLIGALVIFLTILSPFFPFKTLSISFHLDNSYECTNNQIEYFNLINHANISYIVDYLQKKNITNFSNLTKISENKENFINNITNFSTINGGINFEKEQTNLQIINIILSITYTFTIITFIFIFINFPFKFINPIVLIIMSMFFYLFSLISLIFEILDMKIINILYKSLRRFYSRIYKLFGLKIPLSNLNELRFLNNSWKGIFICFFSSNFLFLIIVMIDFDIINSKKKSQNIYKELFNK